MTFNEGVQIDTSRAASTGRGRGIALGGGAGGLGLLIMIVAMFLGVDPGDVISQQAPASQEAAPGFDLNKCRTGADANKYVQCRVVATGNSVDAVWTQLLSGYTRPKMRLFSGQVNTGCGTRSEEHTSELQSRGHLVC